MVVEAGSSAQLRYHRIRRRTVALCEPLAVEDHVLQPIVDVSPPKWHLGHTSWFFAHFLLKGTPFQLPESPADFVFNSYYEGAGSRVQRELRGTYSRPTVADVHAYRRQVDEAMDALMERGLDAQQEAVLELGLNHEQQHQELLVTDIKYILCQEPLFPVYGPFTEGWEQPAGPPVKMPAGTYAIGYEGEGFAFDLERARHQVLLEPYALDAALVTNAEWLEFIADGGYRDHRLWHSEGWAWVQQHAINAPLYWYARPDGWYWFSLQGLVHVPERLPVAHISFYEASAFASWRGCRLPTEQEWEAAHAQLDHGQRWEWTSSALAPYPRYIRAEGTIGEYNGKFMVNQMVLRGASVATPKGHSRPTYRNFFHPPLRWQYTGLRLARTC
jgi:ergothioneine biosynthesis protein EgtB